MITKLPCPEAWQYWDWDTGTERCMNGWRDNPYNHYNFFRDTVFGGPPMLYIVILFCLAMVVWFKAPKVFWGIAAIIGAMMFIKHEEKK